MMIMKKLVMNLDNYSEADREELEKNLMVEIGAMSSGLSAQTAQNTATALQAEMAIQQMQNPQPPAPEEGMPQEGQGGGLAEMSQAPQQGDQAPVRGPEQMEQQ